LNKQVKN